MNILFSLNHSPYSGELTYNALRTAMQLQKESETIQICIYLLSDAVSCAVKNQKPAASSFNIGDILTDLVSKGAKVKICKSCLEARGIAIPILIDGIEVGNMSEYAQWIIKSDKILTF